MDGGRHLVCPNDLAANSVRFSDIEELMQLQERRLLFPDDDRRAEACIRRRNIESKLSRACPDIGAAWWESLSECIVQKHRHSLVPSMEAVLAVLGIEVVH